MWGNPDPRRKAWTEGFPHLVATRSFASHLNPGVLGWIISAFIFFTIPTIVGTYDSRIVGDWKQGFWPGKHPKSQKFSRWGAVWGALCAILFSPPPGGYTRHAGAGRWPARRAWFVSPMAKPQWQPAQPLPQHKGGHPDTTSMAYRPLGNLKWCRGWLWWGGPGFCVGGTPPACPRGL